MTTVHSYTGDQPTLDTMHSDLYRSRSAAMNNEFQHRPVLLVQ